MTSEPSLKLLNRLVGSWTTEATHPALPGIVVRGTVDAEWLEGERFLIHRARTDHPDFPDSIWVLGFTEHDRVTPDAKLAPVPDGEPGLTMHYFDSRGVFRLYQLSVDALAFRFWRDAPGMSQRFTGTFSDDGASVEGVSQLRTDQQWEDDLKITYRRRP